MQHFAFLLLCLCAACSDESTASSTRVWRVAVVPKGTAHEFWKAVESGARQADLELADLEIVWKGPAGEGDAAAQIAVVESFIADGYDGLCLAPLDARALEKPVRQALDAKMRVVIFDSGLADATIPIASYVATDNRHGGEMAAEELARLIGNRGKVALMPYAIGSESTEQRERGFLDAIAKHPGIQVVSKDKHGGPDESRAIEVGENLLATFGDELAGIFCSNESNASGMLTALARDARGLKKEIKLVGFDSSTNLAQGLESGALAATVLQDPVRIGYEAVKAMRAALRGESVPARVETGETLATPSNRSEPRIQALLFPGSAR
jgi:ribose transport system substrate-binding protein